MLNTAIEQTTDTTGTGTYALVASTNPLFRSFVQAIGSGVPVWYRVELGAAWEEGWGIATAGTPDTLTRNVVASSNANALVSWPAGTKRVYCTLLADAARFGGPGVLPTAGGTANALTLTHAPACRVLRPGMVLRFVAGAANTGAATLNVDGLGALPMQRAGGAALGGGELAAGGVVEAVVNAAGTAFLLPNLPDAATGRAALGAAPLPQSGGGTGQFVPISVGTNTNVVLPAGGTWLWHVNQFVGGSFNAAFGGINAGGVTVQAGGPTSSFGGWAWRIG